MHGSDRASGDDPARPRRPPSPRGKSAPAKPWGRDLARRWVARVLAIGSLDARARVLWLQWIATAIISAALLTALIVSGVTAPLDNAIYDQGLRLEHRAVRSDIVIVAVDDASLRSVGPWPWSRLVESNIIDRIGRDGPKAVACYFLFVFPSNKTDDAKLRDAMLRSNVYIETQPSTLSSGRDSWVINPLPMIARAAKGMGVGDGVADKDGVVRRAGLFDGARRRARPRLALQLARLDRPAGAPGRDAQGLDEMLIPFVGPPGSFRTISAGAVLNGRVPPGFFAGKYVLFGSTAPGLLDSHPTPMSIIRLMPTVEIDANILDSLLEGRAIRPVSEWTAVGIWLVPLILVLLSLVWLGPVGNVRLSIAVAPAPILASIALLLGANLWLPPIPFVATLAIILPFWSWRRLAAASAYLSDELDTLRRSVGDAVAPPVSGRGAGDRVLRQITHLEVTKTRIAELQGFVADILANFPDPVLVVDRAGHIRSRNQAANDWANQIRASSALGAPIEPLLRTIQAYGRDPRPLWPPPEISDRFGALGSARPITGIGPTGRAYELRFTPTQNPAGEPTGWVLHLADVTPLVSAMRKREDALEVVSHDMRTPLTAIMAILLHPDFETQPGVMRERIAFQTERTIDLADAFVRLAKADSAEYALEPIDLVHVLMDAMDTVWPVAQAARVVVVFDPDDTEYVVLADRGHLTRALINLLDNAVKFSPVGAEVTCALTPGQLNGRPAVDCAIADVGAGMAQSRVARLMSQFDSARGAVGSVDGVGLGLALVHAVVTRLNGVIRCESAEGKGTIFTITLPLHQDPDHNTLEDGGDA